MLDLSFSSGVESSFDVGAINVIGSQSECRIPSRELGLAPTLENWDQIH